MIAAFEIEKEFHTKVLSEPSKDKRSQLYRDIYTRVFEIYGFEPKLNLEQDVAVKVPVINMFRKQLTGARILDAGCGSGQFLIACSQQLQTDYLLGIDAFVENIVISDKNMEFRQANIAEFDVGTNFDVVMSDNVLEHMAPADLQTHLTSIKNALRPGGILIVLTPNRLFGPWDVTRIIDYSYSGKTAALGTHVNEMTHAELVESLKLAGFGEITSLMPRTNKLKLLKNIQLPAGLMVKLEKCSVLVKFLQKLDKRQYLQAFEIGLVATA